MNRLSLAVLAGGVVLAGALPATEFYQAETEVWLARAKGK